MCARLTRSHRSHSCQTSKTPVEITDLLQRQPRVRPPEKRLGTGVFYLGGHRAPLDPVAACRPVSGLCLRRPCPQAATCRSPTCRWPGGVGGTDAYDVPSLTWRFPGAFVDGAPKHR